MVLDEPSTEGSIRSGATRFAGGFSFTRRPGANPSIDTWRRPDLATERLTPEGQDVDVIRVNGDSLRYVPTATLM
jgi:hypothetical protein